MATPDPLPAIREAVATHALGGFLNALEAAVKPCGASECVPPQVPQAAASIAAMLAALGMPGAPTTVRSLVYASPPHRST